ncbi:hypothetical protein QCA50_003141 [Cerrena zonata]|uniref:Uncharacterized protein n=1 Tax=Cerrena zonata TaxID=2478898 RepID=A0AAW0GNW1_9APHY
MDLFAELLNIPLPVLRRAQRGTANLRSYVLRAIVPRMPWPMSVAQAVIDRMGIHKNYLTVRPENWRTLETTQHISPQFFVEHARFFADHLPQNDLCIPDADRESGESLTVHGLQFTVPERIVGIPKNIDGVTRWVNELPLQTVQRIIHILKPESAPWTFEPVSEPDVDHRTLFRAMKWTRSQHDKPEPDPECSFMVFIQPPWIISDHEMESFTKCKGMPTDATHYTGRERAWAKLWDYCNRHNCHWFAYTTYDTWVFGGFSRGWTRGFTTHVIKYDSTSPTILEALTYWLGSALGLRKGYVIPEVIESVSSHKIDSNVPSPPLCRYPTPPPSETSWGGSSHSNDQLLDSISEKTISDGASEGRLSSNGVVTTRMVLFSDPNGSDPDAWISSVVQGWNEDIPTGEIGGMGFDPLPGVGVEVPPAGGTVSVQVRDPPSDGTLGVWLTSNPIEMRLDDTYLE